MEEIMLQLLVKGKLCYVPIIHADLSCDQSANTLRVQMAALSCESIRHLDL
jgi:hypothetical protein